MTLTLVLWSAAPARPHRASAHDAKTRFASRPRRSIRLDDVLLGVVWILLQIAHGGRIPRLALMDGLDQHRDLVLHHRHVHVEDAVMRDWIDRHRAARQVHRDPAFECFDHLHTIDGAGLPYARRP